MMEDEDARPAEATTERATVEDGRDKASFPVGNFNSNSKNCQVNSLDFLMSDVGLSMAYIHHLEETMPTDTRRNGTSYALMAQGVQRLLSYPGGKEELLADQENWTREQGELPEAETPPTEADLLPPLVRAAKAANTFGKNHTSFLWYPYLPIGDYSVMMAEGGTGKTICCCGIAAAVSTGTPLPGDQFRGEGSNVLLISAEDTGELLRERLELSGADLNRVYILDCDDSIGLNFTAGYDEFEQTVKSCSPALVIVDPWHGFLGADVNINRVNVLRPIFQKLAHLAKTCDCALILVSHVNKRAQGENTNNSAIGSADFINAARSAFRVIFDGDDQDRRVLVHTKSNYAPAGKSVCYRIIDGGLQWDGFSEVTRQTLEAAARRRSTPWEVMQGDKEHASTNEALVRALEASANPYTATRFTYEEFKAKHGELIFGGSQPKRALDAVKERLTEDGYFLRTGVQVRHGKVNGNGFLIQRINTLEAEQVVMNP